MDKEKIHIDEDFLDQSWANMSQILDVEMPVKKRKRRFVWLWLSGLVALTLVGVAYVTNGSSTDINALPIKTNEQLIIENRKEEVADNQLIDLKKEDLKNTPTSTNQKSIGTSSAISTIKNLTLTSPSESVSSTIDSEAGILEEDSRLTIDQFVATHSLIESEEGLTDLPLETNESINMEAKNNLELLAKNRLFISDFNPVPSLDFYPIFNENSFITFPTFPVKKRNEWHFGVYAGKTIPKFGSFRTGIHAQKVFNRKWSLYVGLGYARRVNKLVLNQEGINNNSADTETVELPVGAMAEEDMMSGQGAAAPTQVPPVITNNNISFQNFHYIELPILVQYQFNKRWSLELGGQVSRFYGYRYKNENTSASNFSFDTSFSSSSLDQRSTTLIDSEIAAWDFAVLGGTAFKITPQFQIYTNYRLGLNNYLSNTNNDTNNKKWRQIELGVRYYFK